MYNSSGSSFSSFMIPLALAYSFLLSYVSVSPEAKISARSSCNLYFQGSSTSSPSLTSCLIRLTLAMLGLNGFHLFQTFQHAPQVSDAILKGDFLVLARMGILKQFPHVDWWFLFYRLLLPVGQGRGQKGH